MRQGAYTRLNTTSNAEGKMLLLIDAELKQGTALGFLIKLYKLRA
jgi:hypothetical protein